MAKVEYWKCTLETPEGKRYEGLGWTEAEARTAAGKFARKRNAPAVVTERAEKLTGPAPRTLKPRG